MSKKAPVVVTYAHRINLRGPAHTAKHERRNFPELGLEEFGNHATALCTRIRRNAQSRLCISSIDAVHIPADSERHVRREAQRACSHHHPGWLIDRPGRWLGESLVLPPYSPRPAH
jgi:hypothetical protein